MTKRESKTPAVCWMCAVLLTVNYFILSPEISLSQSMSKVVDGEKTSRNKNDNGNCGHYAVTSRC